MMIEYIWFFLLPIMHTNFPVSIPAVCPSCADVLFVHFFSVAGMLSLSNFDEMQKSSMVPDSCTFVSFEQDTVLLFFLQRCQLQGLPRAHWVTMESCV